MTSSGFPRRSRLAILGVLLVLFGATVPGIAAAESRMGGTVLVDTDETVDGLEAIGGDVTVLGTVDGDLSGVAGSVTVVGNVTGSVDVAAGSIRVEGRVGGDLEAGAGSVTIARDGVVAGDVEVGAGSVTVAGTIEGSARIGADVITVRSSAHVLGDFEYDGDLRRGDGARIDGTVTRNPDLGLGGFFSSGPFPKVGEVVSSIYFFLVNLAMGALLLLAFPRFSDRLATSSVERPGRTSLVGIAALVGIPIGLVLIGLTIVGIPFSLLGIGVYALLLWIGAVYGRLIVGVWLLSLVGEGGRWLGFIVGMLAMVIVQRLPYVGGILELFVLVLGLGALVLGLRRWFRRRRDRDVPSQATIEDYTADAEPPPA